MKQNKQWNVQKIVLIGMLAAFIFISTRFLSIPIMTPAGKTMLKTANALCLLFGILFGGVSGGLAAGIGSALFDLTDPVYAPTAWITFIKFFLMAFVCGKIAHIGGANGNNKKLNLIGAISGAFLMYIMYYTEKIITLMLGGSEFVPALGAVATILPTSVFNIIFAIVVSQILTPILRKALYSTNLYRHATETK